MYSVLSIKNGRRGIAFYASLGCCLASVIVTSLQAQNEVSEASSAVQTIPMEYQKAAPEKDWGIRPEYLLYLPENYQATGEPWPILFFLHGAGHRSDNLQTLTRLAPLTAVVNGGRNYPFLVAAPQCPKGRNWHNDSTQEELMTFVREVVAKYNIDEKRVYISGQSMGGVGTWALLYNNPDYFAAGIPICGANKLEWGESLIDIPIWAFHGRLDKVIVPEYSINLINAIKEAGGKHAKLTIYEDVSHESWWRAFKEPELFPWMLRQKR